jgi:phospholipase D1/2
MIFSAMGGKPYKVGRFAHTLRVRLMREHIGVNVDAMDEEDLMANDPVKPEYEQQPWDPDQEQQHGQEAGVTKEVHNVAGASAGATFVDASKTCKQHTLDAGKFSYVTSSVINGTSEVVKGTTRKTLAKLHVAKGIPDAAQAETGLAEDRTTFTRDGEQVPGFASSVVPTLEEKVVIEQQPPSDKTNGSSLADKLDSEDGKTSQAPAEQATADGEKFGAPADASRSPQTDDEPPHARSGVNDANEEEQAAPEARSHLRRHLGSKLGNKNWTLPVPRPKVDPNGFEDPVCDAFWKDVWVASAAHNVSFYPFKNA